ncbi:hypothetical protein [Kocuria rhizosphaericola]|uniref:hypothetical protein n=1 Tax=Kocuria rhizosphaericola TaxID=3376284 RepID=UPI0037B84D2C
MTSCTEETTVQRGEKDAEDSNSGLWWDLTGEITGYVVKMALTNVRYPTVTRSRWMAEFQSLWGNVGAPGARSEAELIALRDGFHRLENLFVDVNTEGFDHWFELAAEFEAEKSDLSESDLLEDQLALEILSGLYDRTYQRVEMVADHLVPEDLVAFHHMLTHQTHIVQGARIAEKEIARQRRLEEEFAEEDETRSPGPAEIAWDIVGWDSAGEFAADVALTLLTGGAGKVVKVLVKSRKAKKKLSKLNKLRDLRKLRKARRGKKLAKAAKALVYGVPEALRDGLVSEASWIRKNWKKTVKSYITDEIGVAAGGGDPKSSKNLLERAAKNRVSSYVEEAFGFSADREKKIFKTAKYYFAAGLKEQGVRELRRYFLLNLKRRGLAAVVFYALRLGAHETDLKAEVLVDLSGTVAGEMAEDFFNVALGISTGIAKDAVETARKSIQTAVVGAMKSIMGSE